MPLGPGASAYLSSSLAALSKEKGEIFHLFSLAKEYELCLAIEASGLQDPYKFRARRRSVLVAQRIFSENGQLLTEEALHIANTLRKQGHILLCGYDGDDRMVRHMTCVLDRLCYDVNIQKLLKKFQLPEGQRRSLAVIKDSLSLEESSKVSLRDVKVAAIAACLYPLRQNVGSCFATAPAILIQEEQLENMLYDIFEMITLGKITRTQAGATVSAPISPSFGEGDLLRRITMAPLASLVELPPAIAYPLHNAGIVASKEMLERLAREKKESTIGDLFLWFALEELGVSEEEMKRLKFEEGLALERGKFDTLVVERPSQRQQKLIKLEALIHQLKKSFLLMTEDPLARSWEYTLASLSEAARPFLGWHFTPCLGLDPDIEGGIGKVLHDFVKEKIHTSNAILQEHHDQYQRAYDAVRYTEARIKRAENEEEARRLMAELQSSSYHMNACLEMRDRFYTKCSFYPELFSFFIKQLIELFPLYFQEIYDPSMFEVQGDEYSDSPAGFRLVYKHGREDPTLWTVIYSEKLFLKSLVDFFLAVEGQLCFAAEDKGCSDEVHAMVAKVTEHLHSKQFIKVAYHICRKEPASTSALPWCYSSGGSLASFLKVYYQMEIDPLEESFKVESPIDLATELIETLKSLPYNFEASFSSLPDKKMLMHSPTHAFLLRPMQKRWYQAWDSRQFTYTWLRDHFLIPSKAFYQKILLSYDEQMFLLETFLSKVAKEGLSLPPTLLSYKERSPAAFFDSIASHIPTSLLATLEAFLFEALPLKKPEHLYDELIELVSTSSLSLEDLKGNSYYTAKDLIDIACAITLEKEGSIVFEDDKKMQILEKAEEKGFIAPSPLVFADSNWSLYDLGFVVSPVTLKVFLWRLCPYARQGVGMYSWGEGFTLASKQPWSLFTKPFQYGLLHHKTL